MKRKLQIQSYLGLALLVWAMGSPAVAQTSVPTHAEKTTMLSQLPKSPMVTKYQLYDVGTLGGSDSVFYNWDYTGGNFSTSPFNRVGQLAGSSVLPDDPNLVGSYLWSFGKLQKLPTLPDGNLYDGGSNANAVNNLGVAAGASAYGVLSPYNGQPYYHAVSWKNGVVKDLGDLGGGESWANSINDSGLVAGFADNTISDPYSFYGTQFHASIWQGGSIRDLGTLGGTDSEAWSVNDRGDVIGISFLDSPPVPPFNQPQTDAFLWSKGHMADLGNLGGGFSTPSAINQNGQVTVISFDSNNQHILSYLWSSGKKYVLPSLGGTFVEASSLNDWGLATGAGTDSTDSNFIAGVWIPLLHLKLLLGTVGGDTGSIGLAVNNLGVVVGGSGVLSLSGTSYSHAFVWQLGELRDLNTLIPPHSAFTLNVAYAINDRGMIAALGTNAQGHTHAFVLVPGGDRSDGPATVASNPAAPGSYLDVPPRLQHEVSGAH